MEAQSKALSQVYKSLLAYERVNQRDRYSDKTQGFFDAVGHQKCKEELFSTGSFGARVAYITSVENPKVTVNVLSYQEFKNGKPVVTTEVTVKSGKTTEKISSADMTIKEFNKALARIKEEFELKSCICKGSLGELKVEQTKLQKEGVKENNVRDKHVQDEGVVHGRKAQQKVS